MIPSDMILHNLHYAIQRLFGWQNSHLRKFYLPQDAYQKLTDSTIKGWSDLVGILFQPPGEAESDVFWDDNYQSGSIKVWLKKKYTSPYFYGGAMEHFNAARRDVKDLLDNFAMIDVKESFHEYWKRKLVEENTETVMSKHKPVCIHKEGIFVLDDVGGLCGFADFLGRIYESEDKEERAELRTWAQSLGWNSKRISNKMML